MLTRTRLMAFTLAALAFAGSALANDRRLADVLADARYSTLSKAVAAAGLGEALTGSDDLTVFAPTDDAFAKLPAGTIENLLKPESKADLTALLQRHIVAGRLGSDEVKRLRSVNTLGGEEVAVRLQNGRLRVGPAKVIGREAVAANGIVHAIDAVITP
jgi:uncharacterized surface protein with fasciclin (FAS1) repeats